MIFFELSCLQLDTWVSYVLSEIQLQVAITYTIDLAEWSLANICPLFKKGDRSLARIYRPVSLTCIPCKLLEHIVCSR